MSESLKCLENIWIGDHGASCHYYISDHRFFDVEVVSQRIKVGSGRTMEAIKIESLR